MAITSRIDKLIRSCNMATVPECMEQIHNLNEDDREVLIRVFEYSSDKRFGDSLLVALDYLIK